VAVCGLRCLKGVVIHRLASPPHAASLLVVGSRYTLSPLDTVGYLIHHFALTPSHARQPTAAVAPGICLPLLPPKKTIADVCPWLGLEVRVKIGFLCLGFGLNYLLDGVSVKVIFSGR